MATHEETENMQYVTNIERQGIQKGILQNSHEALIEVLKVRFQNVPDTLIAQIEALTEVSQLSSLLREAVVIDSLASFARRLRNPLTMPTVTKIKKKPSSRR